jgi:HEAT repeat protein
VAEDEEPVAFVARVLNLLIPDEPRYRGHVESELPTPHLIEDGPGWNDVEEAISWARERAPEVLVRLGVETTYSAGTSLPPADRWTWEEAAHELGALRMGEAFDGLVAALAIEDQGVAATAALALVDLGDRRAVGPLAAVLEAASSAEPIRIHSVFAAVGALGRFDDPAARQAVAHFKAGHGWR